MEYKIINRVSKSKITTIDFNDFLTQTIFEIFDLKDWLKDEIILIEAEFRQKIKDYDWSDFKNKTESISIINSELTSSNENILNTYMLSELKSDSSYNEFSGSI